MFRSVALYRKVYAIGQDILSFLQCGGVRPPLQQTMPSCTLCFHYFAGVRYLLHSGEEVTPQRRADRMSTSQKRFTVTRPHNDQGVATGCFEIHARCFARSLSMLHDHAYFP